jgi:hypothetical protein
MADCIACGAAAPNPNVKRYLINYPHLSDYGQTIFVFLFHRGTEQPHQGDMKNSTSPNMFIIHKKYISRTQSDQKIRYNYSATPFVYSIRW